MVGLRSRIRTQRRRHPRVRAAGWKRHGTIHVTNSMRG